MPFYTVEYLFENVADSNYSLDSSFPAEKFYGEENTLTDTKAKNIAGFIAEEISQKTISSDNSTLISVKYKRKIITLYIDLKGGIGTRFIQGKFGEDNASVKEKLSLLKLPVRPGFSLDEENVYSVPEDLDFSLQNDESTVISVNWTGGSAASYAVVVLKERADFATADERYEVYDTQILKGFAGDKTDFTEDKAAKSITIEGFSYSFPHFAPGDNENIEIDGDDSTVLYIYFNRDVINLTYDLKGGNINGNTSPVVISGRYDSIINSNSIPQNLSREGCVSYAWDSSYTKFPAEDKVINARWTGKTYTVTFHLGDATEQKTYNYLGDYSVPSISEFSTLSIDDCGVSGWKLNETSSQVDFPCGNYFTLPEPKDYDVYAQAEYHFYTVKYLYQNPDDDDYTLQTETDKIYASVGSQTSVLPKQITGFHALDYVPATVAEDDSTVLEIKYDRNMYTLSFDLGEGGFAYINEKDENNYDKKIYSLPSVQVRYGADYSTRDYRPQRNGFYYGQMKWIFEDGTDASEVFDPTYSFSSSSHKGYTVKNITSNTIVYLTGRLVTYTVTLKNTNDPNIQFEYTVDVNSEDCLFPKLNLGGYEFRGWYYDACLKTPVGLDENSIKKIAITEPYRSDIKNVSFYAKWVPSTQPAESTTVKSVGDIVLNNGKVINIPTNNEKPAIDGLYIELTDTQKNNAIGVVTHKVNDEWRILGKNSREVLAIGELAATRKVPEEGKNAWRRFDDYGFGNGEKDDGYLIYEKYYDTTKKYEDNTKSKYDLLLERSDAWKYIFDYGTANDLPSKYETGWYIPGINELKALSENYGTIATMHDIIGGNDINKYSIWSCSYGILEFTDFNCREFNEKNQF